MGVVTVVKYVCVVHIDWRRVSREHMMLSNDHLDQLELGLLMLYLPGGQLKRFW